MLNPEILDTLLRLLDEAKASGEREPSAMNLATVDSSGSVAWVVTTGEIRGAPIDSRRSAWLRQAENLSSR